MKLEQFKEKNEKKKIIIIFSVVIVLLITGLFLYQSFAFFESQKNYDVIKGIVSYNPSDITIVSYLDGTISKTFPNKDDKYAVDSVECSNGAIGTWNYANWEVNIQNLTNTRTKCKVYFVTRYKESILNGTDPIISESLIPVTIANDGVVTKADMKSEWYNYSNKQWANAVILEDETANYQNGEVIPESNIESYFVWIPRYKYKIFNEGNYNGLSTASYQEKSQEIEVIFENKNTTVSNGSTVGSYLTHPAFTSFDSNGMWVGKFETGYKGATTKVDAQQNIFDISKIEVKPNVISWRGIQVANAHLNSFNYQRELDSHMMKNTEWGAVAYLQHSKYGSMTSVRINNNSDSKTGYSAVSEPTCGYIGNNSDCNQYGTTENITLLYNTSIGYLASTTGNISGIYDMSGGSWEYMMGVVKDSNENPMTGRSYYYHSGFNGSYGCPSCDNSPNGENIYSSGIDFPNRKYYDTYESNELDFVYQRRILGDATGEMGPFINVTYNSNRRTISSWYSDESLFVYLYSPWFLRSGPYSYGLGTGIFTFANTYGHAVNSNTYRIVLMP